MAQILAYLKFDGNCREAKGANFGAVTDKFGINWYISKI